MDSGQNKSNKQILLSGAETLLYIFIGLYFYYYTSKPDVGMIVWFVGISLVINRNITNHFDTNSHEMINERIDRIKKRIDRIGQVIDLENKNDFDLVSKVCDSYLHIPDQEFDTVKDEILNEALERLVKIRTEKSTDLLSTSEYYIWLLNRLEKTTKDHSIQAVSCMLKAEWNNSTLEQKFIEGNLVAAKKGAIVERIFVTTRNVLNNSLKNDAVINHTQEKRSETQLIGFFTDVDKLHANNESKLLKSIGDGYIIFKSVSTKVAVIELSYGGSVGGRVTTDENIIRDIEESFGILKMMSSDLSISLINDPDSRIDPDKKR